MESGKTNGTAQAGKVCDILASLEDLGAAGDDVSVGDVVERFGTRSYGPFLLIPALVCISPVGGIPGVPTFFAVLIGLFAVQMVLGRRSLWLPGFIERRCVSGYRLSEAAGKMGGAGRFLDRWFHGRMEWLTAEPVPRLAAAAVVALCALTPPLEMLPFAVIVPMSVIAAFGLALLVRDGLLMLVALAGSLAAFALAFSMLGGGGGG